MDDITPIEIGRKAREWSVEWAYDSTDAIWFWHWYLREFQVRLEPADFRRHLDVAAVFASMQNLDVKRVLMSQSRGSEARGSEDSDG